MPPPKLSLSQWADERRYLPGESAAEPGRWKTSRVEFAREPMDCVSDPTVGDIVIVSAAQMLKTELLLNTIGYYSDYDPCPMMMVQPTIEMAESVSNDRISPTIRDTPVLRAIFGDPKTKTTGNTILHKKFAGGHLTLAGANSPATLASRPIRVLACDEIDRWEESVGNEGDPVDIANQRTDTFWNRKRLLVSTPTIKGHSRIWAAFEESDQRFYHIPCARCGVFHKLEWGNVVWGENTPAAGNWRKAVFQCPHCNGHFTNKEKDAAVKKGRWIATAPFAGTAGFQISKLYSPWQNSRLEKIVEGFIKAKGNPGRMQVWVNTVLGETYDEAGDIVSDSDLEARAERYPVDSKGSVLIPGRVLLLVAGADTQPDRIEAECVGFGAGEESWSIDYQIFYGDPDIAEGQPGSPWDAFTDWVKMNRKHERGIDMAISHTCIDTGGSNTQAVYGYVKRHRGDRIYGIKGMTGADRPIIGSVSRKRSGRKTGRPIDLYPIGHDAAKSNVMGRFKIAEPGPGYCHFPIGREPEYFRQLTSEKCVTKYVKGRAKREWVPIAGRRNEALDCRCYATGALMMAAPQFDKLAFRMKKRIEELAPAEAEPKNDTPPEDADDGDATDAVDDQSEPVKSAAKPPKRKRSRSGYQIRTW